MKLLQLVKAKIKKCLVYISGRTALDNAPSIAINKGLLAAFAYLRKKYRFYRPAAARFWIFLYEYLIQLESNHSLNDLKPGAFIVHFCCWGKDYTAKAKNYLIASLNTEGNLQSIVKSREVVVLIHCDQAAKNELAGSHVVKIMQETMRVVFFVLPQPLLDACHASCHYPNVSYFKRVNRIHYNNKYFLLGGMQTHAFKVALQNKAYISFMMPDFLLSDSFFQYAFSKIENKTLVVTTAFRTNYATVKKAIDSMYGELDRSSLSIAAPLLTQLQIEHMHVAAKRRIVSESTENFAPTPQLIFEAPNGFVVRTFHYHPILIDCKQIDHEIRLDYMAIDYLLLNQMLKNDLPYEDQLWVCDDSSQMAVMELSAEDVENHFDVKQTMAYHELIDQIFRMIENSPSVYDTPLNYYFSSIRHRIVSDKFYRMKKEHLDDISFFSKLASLRE